MPQNVPQKNVFGGALAASTSALPVEEEGEVAGSERQKHTDRVREEAEEEESDHDRAMGASEEKMEERVIDDVVRSRQINRDSEREGGCVCFCIVFSRHLNN